MNMKALTLTLLAFLAVSTVFALGASCRDASAESIDIVNPYKVVHADSDMGAEPTGEPIDTPVMPA